MRSHGRVLSSARHELQWMPTRGRRWGWLVAVVGVALLVGVVA